MRQAGFAGRWRHRPEAFEGGWITRSDDGLTWLDPDGLLTQAVLVSEDSPLGWYYNQHREQGDPLILHPTAIVEITLEFFRLLYLLIKPLAGTGRWQHHVCCRRFRSHQVNLGEQESGLPAAIAGRQLASSDDWTKQFEEHGDPHRDAFEALARFYALFGLSSESVPLVDAGAVSESALVALGMTD